MLVILVSLSKDTSGLRTLNQTQPAKFKGKSKKSKTDSTEYREWMFKSEYFFINHAYGIL
jgi:hypothetical protein